MRSAFLAVFALLVVIVSVPARASSPAASTLKSIKPSVIYGKDDRLDLYQVQDPAVLALSDSTVALMNSGKIEIDEKLGLAKIRGSHYGTSNNLCKTERFYNQSTAAFCSGSLVAPDIVMTAGHCIGSEWDCKNTRYVFGFGVTREGEMPTTVPADEVYECAALLGRQQVNAGADWALVRLTRPVTSHRPLYLNREASTPRGTRLVVIGHPSGLPTKVAGGAVVRSDSPRSHFIANLDTYGGNSGSAVFNADTGLVEGILVRGEVDFTYDSAKGCSVSRVCKDELCRGEDVTKIAEVLPLLDTL